MEKVQLEQHRKATLRLYEAIKKEYPKELSKDLQTLHRNISENKFLLAVMGEVKAGKSTFINAILGEKILPSDARQATSAIIEIFKADKKFIKATFANGREETMEDDLDTPEIDEAIEFLREIASVQDEYRDLPIVQLNDFIIDKFDEKTGIAVYTEEELDYWINETNLENTHKLANDEFNNKIKAYINEKRGGDNIPKNIAVGYPLNFKFDQFRIVDTPGIGAIGGIEAQTKRFIEKADAVIYLHKGAASAKFLQHAWQHEITKKTKKNLIVVLTHRSNDTEEDNNKKLEETRDNFSQIDAKRIFSVDSLTELSLNKKLYDKSISEIKDLLDNNEEIEKVAARPFLKSQGDVDEFFALMEKQANMKELKKTLKQFSEDAIEIQLRNFVVEMREHFDVAVGDCKYRLNKLNAKYKNPQTFAREEKKAIEKIEIYKSNMQKFSTKLKNNYNVKSVGSKKHDGFERLFEDFKLQLNGKKFTAKDSKKDVDSAINTLVRDFNEELTSFIKELETEINKTIRDFQVKESNSIAIEVPKIVMSTIWKKSKIEATIQVEKTFDDKGAWAALIRKILFVKWRRHKRNVPDIDKYWKDKREELIRKADENKKSISDQINDLIEDSIDKYNNENSKKLKERKSFLKRLKKDKVSNQKIEMDIRCYENKLEHLNNSMEECDKILGEL